MVDATAVITDRPSAVEPLQSPRLAQAAEVAEPEPEVAEYKFPEPKLQENDADPFPELSVKASSTFSASVSKGERPMGMDVNYHDDSTLLITRVKAGPVDDYNQANSSMQIAAGDRLVAVNGVAGDAKLMVKATKSEHLELTVRACEENTVRLEKRFPDQELGLALVNCDTQTLVIHTVEQDGDSAAAEFNRRSTGFKLAKDFRVIGVNGIRGDGPKLTATLKSAESWELTIRQVWPES